MEKNKYYLQYRSDIKEPTEWWYYTIYINRPLTSYFKNEELAKKAIKLMGDDILLLFE